MKGILTRSLVVFIICIFFCTAYLSYPSSSFDLEQTFDLKDLIISAQHLSIGNGDKTFSTHFIQFCQSAQIVAGLKTSISKSDSSDNSIHSNQSFLLPDSTHVELSQRVQYIAIQSTEWKTICFAPLIRPPIS